MAQLNSDDFDFGEAPEKTRFTNLGKRSITQMLENATGDRFESKKQSKHLALTHQSPQVEYHMQLWYARLTAFRRDTLAIKK